jgi:hypothetical protein
VLVEVVSDVLIFKVLTDVCDATRNAIKASKTVSNRAIITKKATTSFKFIATRLKSMPEI